MEVTYINCLSMKLFLVDNQCFVRGKRSVIRTNRNAGIHCNYSKIPCTFLNEYSRRDTFNLSFVLPWLCVSREATFNTQKADHENVTLLTYRHSSCYQNHTFWELNPMSWTINFRYHTIATCFSMMNGVY